MSIIAQIKLAWKATMDIVNKPKSTYKEMVKLDLDEEFMKRLYRIPNTNINTVVRVMWESYNQLVISGDRLLIKHDELKTENMTLIAKSTKVINECHGQIEALESSLNTSRYFIFLSGMCGFVLGLACLYFVV